MTFKMAPLVLEAQAMVRLEADRREVERHYNRESMAIESRSMDGWEFNHGLS